MKRKLQFGFIILFATASLLLTNCGTLLPPKTYTIGVVNPSPKQENTIKGFKEGMAALGYVEGKNVNYLYDGPVSADQLDVVAQGLVKAKVNLILALTTPAAKAVQKATAGTDIAMVFIPVTDPVGAGIVASLTKPGGNATGVTYITQEGKRLEWLLQVVPTIKHVYIPYNPQDQSPVLALNTVRETAAKLGVELITFEADTAEKANAAFENIPTEADAIFLLPDIVMNNSVANMYERAIELKLPTSGPAILSVNEGALTAYGVDLAVAARKQAARLAAQILQGARPADLPVEMAEFFSGVNLKTAQTLGLDIPDTILRQANIIIR